MDTNYPEVPGERAEQQGVLSAARDFREDVLLLAAKTTHSGSGAGGATDYGAGAGGGKTGRNAVIRYRGAERTLPAETDIEAIAAVLRSLQQL